MPTVFITQYNRGFQICKNVIFAVLTYLAILKLTIRMSTTIKKRQLLGITICTIALFSAPSASAQFVAFWDHCPGTNQTQTHTNTSLGDALYVLDGRATFVPLKNITNGVQTAVTLVLTNIGDPLGGTWWIGPDSSAKTPAPGTPLYQTFYYNTTDPRTGNPTTNTYVYFGQINSESNIRFVDVTVGYVFTGLNPDARYRFRGGAVRGASASYANRWTQVEISGAPSFTPVMTANVLSHSQVSGLADNQVAVCFALNNTTGDMVGWDNIEPGPDGSFSILCTRYTGEVPGGSSDGSHGYAITGLRIEETLPAKLQYEKTPNGTVRFSWPPGSGVLQRSLDLHDWSDYSVTNGETITPTGTWFYRLRQ
jgi:hypothetical protein